jgi:hypothetical protein
VDLADRFNKMISYCDELVLAPYMRERLKGQLHYFKIQALCDVDRRENAKVIAMNWEMFRRVHRAQLIIDKFRADRAFWQPIAEFVGDRALGFDAATKTATKESVQPDQFFINLYRDARSKIPDKDGLHKSVVCLGLRYLADACRLKKHERDPQYIKHVWKLIWPSLERAQLLTNFRQDDVVRARVQNFIANGFYYLDQEGRPQVESVRKSPRKGNPDHDYTGRRGINPRNLGPHDLAPRAPLAKFIEYEDPASVGHCPPTSRQFDRPKL